MANEELIEEAMVPSTIFFLLILFALLVLLLIHDFMGEIYKVQKVIWIQFSVSEDSANCVFCFSFMIWGWLNPWMWN